MALAAQNKRKEKARIAARARRSQEASIIMDMANELHITQEKIRRLDKATIVKLAIDYIRAFEVLCRSRMISSANSTIPAAIHCCTSSPSLLNSPNEASSSSNSANEEILNYDSNTTDNNNDNDNDDSIQINETTITTSRQQQQQQQQNKQQQQQLNPPIPKFNTGSIFAHKTEEVDSHFLVIKEQNGRAAFVLKPDAEIMDEDDLTHLAPQAGDSVSLEVEPLDEIIIDSSLFKICGCRC